MYPPVSLLKKTQYFKCIFKCLCPWGRVRILQLFHQTETNGKWACQKENVGGGEPEVLWEVNEAEGAAEGSALKVSAPCLPAVRDSALEESGYRTWIQPLLSTYMTSGKTHRCHSPHIHKSMLSLCHNANRSIKYSTIQEGAYFRAWLHKCCGHLSMIKNTSRYLKIHLGFLYSVLKTQTQSLDFLTLFLPSNPYFIYILLQTRHLLGVRDIKY